MSDLISRQAAIDALKKLLYETALVNSYDATISDVYAEIAENRIETWVNLIPPAQRWIPVSERLPDNANVKGAFCPKYYVTTEFGQTEGWYNPDAGGWYVLLWFMDARFEKWNVSLDRGTVPKLVFGVPVIAWMPLPEPYKEVKDD